MNQEFSSVLKNTVDNLLSGIHTVLPGKIESYDPTLKKVSVKPLIQKVFETETLSLPVISDVPIVMPGTNEMIISLPIKKGDGCLVLFSERSLEAYMSSNLADVEPQDPRRFSLSDAICIPGLFTFFSPGKT